MSQQKFTLLRKLLSALGLSADRIDELIATIQDWLSEGKGGEAAEPLPYRLRDDFLSPAERRFYRILQQTTTDWAILHTKVNLGDLFYPATRDRSQRQIYRNKIDRKHVDYLLCDPQTLQPILGIELDDKSHQRPDRQERDEFVDAVFAAAGLPITHVPVAKGYDLEKLRQFLARKANRPLDESAPAEPDIYPSLPSQPETPTCPNCESEMVLRTAKRGANEGNQFWGCSNYPKCRTILPCQPLAE